MNTVIQLNIYYTERKNRRNFIIWAAGNNGQLSRNPENDGEIIGKWAAASETDTGNGGGESAKHCRKQQSLYRELLFREKGKRQTSPHGRTATKLVTYKLTT